MYSREPSLIRMHGEGGGPITVEMYAERTAVTDHLYSRNARRTFGNSVRSDTRAPAMGDVTSISATCDRSLLNKFLFSSLPFSFQMIARVRYYRTLDICDVSRERITKVDIVFSLIISIDCADPFRKLSFVITSQLPAM